MDKVTEKHRCEYWGLLDGWHNTQCSNNASICRNGVWYCGKHDPVKVAERNAKSRAKMDEKDRIRQLEITARKACEAVNPVHPEKVAKEIVNMRNLLRSIKETQKSMMSHNPDIGDMESHLSLINEFVNIMHYTITDLLSRMEDVNENNT